MAGAKAQCVFQRSRGVLIPGQSNACNTLSPVQQFFILAFHQRFFKTGQRAFIVKLRDGFHPLINILLLFPYATARQQQHGTGGQQQYPDSYPYLHTELFFSFISVPISFPSPLNQLIQDGMANGPLRHGKSEILRNGSADYGKGICIFQTAAALHRR